MLSHIDDAKKNLRTHVTRGLNRCDGVFAPIAVRLSGYLDGGMDEIEQVATDRQSLIEQINRHASAAADFCAKCPRLTQEQAAAVAMVRTIPSIIDSSSPTVEELQNAFEKLRSVSARIIDAKITLRAQLDTVQDAREKAMARLLELAWRYGLDDINVDALMSPK